MRCDHGHEWGGLHEESNPPSKLCEHGHEAITIQKEKPIDFVQVTLFPAGRLVDSVKKQYASERRYRLIISDIDKTWVYESKKTYLWPEALKLSALFQERSLAQAKHTIERRQDEI